MQLDPHYCTLREHSTYVSFKKMVFVAKNQGQLFVRRRISTLSHDHPSATSYKHPTKTITHKKIGSPKTRRRSARIPTDLRVFLHGSPSQRDPPPVGAYPNGLRVFLNGSPRQADPPPVGKNHEFVAAVCDRARVRPRLIARKHDLISSYLL